jgi:hypothetical protein
MSLLELLAQLSFLAVQFTHKTCNTRFMSFLRKLPCDGDPGLAEVEVEPFPHWITQEAAAYR